MHLLFTESHCISKYKDGLAAIERTVVHHTKYPGNGAIALQHEGKIMAVGGWDGKSVVNSFGRHFLNNHYFKDKVIFN